MCLWMNGLYDVEVLGEVSEGFDDFCQGLWFCVFSVVYCDVEQGMRRCCVEKFCDVFLCDGFGRCEVFCCIEYDVVYDVYCCEVFVVQLFVGLCGWCEVLVGELVGQYLVDFFWYCWVVGVQFCFDV